MRSIVLKDNVRGRGLFVDRRGDSDWTLRKVVTLILGVVILILMVVGIVTGQLTPLFEHVKGNIDSVLVMFGLKDGGNVVGARDCVKYSLDEMEGGGDLLKSLKENSGEFEVCASGNCYVTLGKKNYFYNRKINRMSDMDESVPVVYIQPDEFSLKDWKMYNLVIDDLSKSLDADSDLALRGKLEKYFKGYTKSFILYGDGAGAGDSPVSASWQDGHWIVFESSQVGWWWDNEEFKVLYEGDDDVKALDEFYNQVNDYYDDSVYFEVSFSKKQGESYIGAPISETGDSIEKIVGAAGGNHALDGDAELSKLKSWWVDKKKELIENSLPKVGSQEDFKKLIVGHKVDLGDFGVAEISDVDFFDALHPVIGFKMSDGNVYGLRFVGIETEYLSDTVKRKVQSVEGDYVYDEIKLRQTPFELVHKEGDGYVGVGDLKDYALPEVYLEGFLNNLLIKEFVKKSCK